MSERTLPLANKAAEMTRIAIDAMGGDHAPHEVVAGAVWGAYEYGVALELVGKQDRIESCLDKIQREGFFSRKTYLQSWTERFHLSIPGI